MVQSRQDFGYEDHKRRIERFDMNKKKLKINFRQTSPDANSQRILDIFLTQ